MNLDKEAEEYAWKKKNPFSVQLLANELVLATKTDFIAGANSKYVQAKILQAHIDILERYASRSYNMEDLIYHGELVEKQLKQLEDEANK